MPFEDLWSENLTRAGDREIMIYLVDGRMQLAKILEFDEDCLLCVDGSGDQILIPRRHITMIRLYQPSAQAGTREAETLP